MNEESNRQSLSREELSRLEATLLQKPAKFPQELHPEIVMHHFYYGFMTAVGDAGA